MYHWSLQGRSSNCCDPLSDGYAFSQDENGVVSQSEVIRAYDTTKQRTNEWWAAGPIGATAAVSDGDIWSSTGRRRGASECLQHRGDFFGTLKWNGQKERETSSCVWKREEKKKNKEQNKTVFTFSCSCVSSRHDEHCAFLAVCGLKFFTVLAQFVGVNVSSLLKLL